jgi:hypothetical protein
MSSNINKNLVNGLFCFIFLLTVLACSFETKNAPTYQSNEEKVLVENRDEDKEKAKKAVENFHKLFNEEKYGELFQLIDDKSQLKQDQTIFLMRMDKIMSDLGKFESATFTRANVFKKNSTYEVRIEYISKFAKENNRPPRYELFFWELYPNGDAKLLEYINGIDNEKRY